MPLQKYSARVSDIQHFSDKYVHLYIELVEPHRLEFLAGQYMILDVPGSDKKKDYSIASDPAIDHAIESLIDISPRGAGTTYIAALKPGDPVTFFAPAGMFGIAGPDTVVGQQEKALVFVATGSGITPIRSMILDQLQNKGDKRPVTLYWGMRYESDIYWLDEFRELEKSFPNFTLHLVLSKAGDEWPLCRGRVTDCLSIHPMLDSAGYYICGLKVMITDVEALLLQKGVAAEHIHHEEFH